MLLYEVRAGLKSNKSYSHIDLFESMLPLQVDAGMANGDRDPVIPMGLV